MDNDRQKPFKPELQARIMGNVKRYERRVLLLKTAGFGAALLASFGIMIEAGLNLISALAQSGFFNFASLFFSDFSATMANFQDFAFSILESFPVFSAAFLVVGVIAVIWTASRFVGDVRQIRATRVAGFSYS